MEQDKLDQDQRIRLEALAQAISYTMLGAAKTGVRPSEDGVVSSAKRFATWIENAG